MFSFLDTAIHEREDGTIQYEVYRQSTWNSLNLNFINFCPNNYKASIRALFHCVEKICTIDKLEELMNFENCLRDDSSSINF